MRTPTDEQQAILDSNARIRVVRAIPGSGKTWLVAELIRQELDKWPKRTCGIAALSFTRIGGEEIRKAVGHELSHPHFVGTIDAFLFRYVIRTFLSQWLAKSGHPNLPKIKPPRLIPKESGIQHWRQYDLGKPKKTLNDLGEPKKTPINLCDVVWTCEDQNGKAKAAYKLRRSQTLQPLSDNVLKVVIEDKKKIWEKYGHLTHSDAAMWASYLLRSSTFGAVIRAEIVRRFPLMIVDELQDTGFFLGKSILSILGEATTRGVLVGDPDQAIFEFTGAKPELFTQFMSISDSVSLPLSISRRCPASVATVASCLKDSPGTITPTNEKAGQAILLIYTDMVPDIHRLADKIRQEKKDSNIKVIGRSSSTIEAIIGKSTDTAPKLRCQATYHLHSAVALFRQGYTNKAVATAYRAIEQAVFKDNDIDINEKLKKHGIDLNRWKRLATDCMLRANAEEETETVYEWQVKMGQILDEEIYKFDLLPPLDFTVGNLKPQKLKNVGDKACADYLPQNSKSSTGLSEVPVQTIHSVKGETHDVTVFVCPDRGSTHCPSARWWSEKEEDREEKRIAYVAMTRTQGDLILCVSDACYQRLCQKQPEFVESFKCFTVDEYLGVIALSD